MESPEKVKAMLEGLLFLSSQPVSMNELKALTELHENDIQGIMEELVSEYSERAGGVLIGKVAGGFQMYVNPSHNDLIKKLKGVAKAQKLSMASLETLAIIAYRQPLTKAEVEEIRSVNSDGVLKSLLDKRMIKIVGKKEAPGKPILYGTTKEFLQYFSLNDLTELPTLKDMEREDAV